MTVGARQGEWGRAHQVLASAGAAWGARGSGCTRRRRDQCLSRTRSRNGQRGWRAHGCQRLRLCCGAHGGRRYAFGGMRARACQSARRWVLTCQSLPAQAGHGSISICTAAQQPFSGVSRSTPFPPFPRCWRRHLPLSHFREAGARLRETKEERAARGKRGPFARAGARRRGQAARGRWRDRGKDGSDEKRAAKAALCGAGEGAIPAPPLTAARSAARRCVPRSAGGWRTACPRRR